MAYPRPGGSSSFQQAQVAFPPSFAPHLPIASPSSSSSSRYAVGPDINPSPCSQPFVDSQFDIFDWHLRYQSCVRYFLDHAQHSGPVQAVAAFVNIQLPFQRSLHPIFSSSATGSPAPAPGGPEPSRAAGKLPMGAVPLQPIPHITLVPYIRRLVATGFDFPAVLHGFFGDDWMAGVGRLHEAERRNYLFAAKSANWLKVKAGYDMGENQTVPFLQPLQNVEEKEIVSAEAKWSEWLAMGDWMLGPRAPVDVAEGHRGVQIKREDEQT